ncbi:MAG: radical SAM protein [Candidatus Altiarchaeota archaeon]|nr:radical SAM protein [Candidatus Altiarchaeota archaeon]
MQGWYYPNPEKIREIKNENKKLYRRIGRPSKAEIDVYRSERRQLIDGLISRGLKATQEGNSLFYGDLSKGCRLCKRGKWICIFITEKCTRHCFYCPQPRNKPEKDYVKCDYSIFHNPSQLISFLKRWNIEGVGISGGEPLCVLDRALDFISAMKDNMSEDFYIWLYTNGDLASKKTLNALRDSGLDELRFDLAAREYDTKPLKNAVKSVDVVSVEIPAIPEDEEKVKKLLPELKKIGVKYLNLHELTFSKNNLRDMSSRGYKVLIGSSENDFMSDIMPVYGSELAALRIIDSTIEKNIELPINFCPSYYKKHVQGAMIIKNMTEIIRKPHEEVTENGCIKKIVVTESLEKIKELIRILKKKGLPPEKIYFCRKKNRLELHADLLSNIDLKKFKAFLVLERYCIRCGDNHTLCLMDLCIQKTT